MEGNILRIIAICFLGFLVFGEYILERDKDWRRIWEKMSRPKVNSIKELKKLIKG